MRLLTDYGVGGSGGDISEGLSPVELRLWQIVRINGGRYLVAGKFSKPCAQGMSLFLFRRLDDGTFAKAAFHESYLRGIKIEKLLTARGFSRYLTQIDNFIKKHGEYLNKSHDRSLFG